MPSLLLPSWVGLARSHRLPEPQLLHLQNGAKSLVMTFGWHDGQARDANAHPILKLSK